MGLTTLLGQPQEEADQGARPSAKVMGVPPPAFAPLHSFACVGRSLLSHNLTIIVVKKGRVCERNPITRI